MRLAERPERRRMIWTRVELPEGRVCVANLHASAGLPPRRRRGAERAAGQALEWAADDPLVLGGDFNLRPRRDAEAFAALEERFGSASPPGPRRSTTCSPAGSAWRSARGRLDAAERELEEPGGGRIRLSDHAPVAARFGLP